MPHHFAPVFAAMKRLPAVFWGIVLACCLPELVLQGADYGLYGSARWRPLAYQNAGFWAGLLRDWQPNYAAQPYVMFASYGFLHAGLVHLSGNMITLLATGPMVIARFGTRGFAVIYALSVLGGALCFGLLSLGVAAMIGASGAVSGLIGALIIHEFSLGQGPRRYRVMLFQIGLLIALNAASWWLEGGLLAWQAHMGGSVAGMAAGYALLRRA